jgi:tubulin-specific chaperone C, putative
MLVRKVKNPIKLFPFVKAFIAFEVGLFLGSYYIFHRLSTQRDFRYYCHQNWKLSLEYYYKFLKLMGDKEEQLKRQDYEIWGVLNNNDQTI